VKNQFLLIIIAASFLSCAAVRRFEELESRVDNFEQELKETNKDVEFLSRKLSALQNATEELAQKLKQNLKAFEDIDVAPAVASPPSGIPENFLIEDRQRASTESLRVRAALYNFLNAITLGEFSKALSLSETTRTISLVAQEIVDFWLVDCLIRLNDYKQALQASAVFIQNYENHPRIPYVLLRQASIFSSLGDKQASEITLRKLIKDYPKSPESEIAKKALSAKN
jgi:TolA-binding protein